MLDVVKQETSCMSFSSSLNRIHPSHQSSCSVPPYPHSIPTTMFVGKINMLRLKSPVFCELFRLFPSDFGHKVDRGSATWQKNGCCGSSGATKPWTAGEKNPWRSRWIEFSGPYIQKSWICGEFECFVQFMFMFDPWQVFIYLQYANIA